VTLLENAVKLDELARQMMFEAVGALLTPEPPPWGGPSQQCASGLVPDPQWREGAIWLLREVSHCL
jgi:hypothetical protein